jgi:hypothetical protein
MTAPKLSIIVVFFRIPRQADNTLYSLSVAHQRHVSADDYEIIVVENASDAIYGEERALGHGPNVRYFLREEPGVSPVPAVNFGFGAARAPLIGLVVDGAHMMTPRVVEYALMAARIHDCPVIDVPAHHLGAAYHHLNLTSGHDEATEIRLLDECRWKENGYALFDVACWSEANENGFFCPTMESNCLFCTREAFERIGRADPRFDGAGGGLVNQDVFARLVRVPGSKLVMLAGEGSFHQFHGGVSTSGYEGREEALEALRVQNERIRGHRIIGHDREPFVLGTFSPESLRHLARSAELGLLRALMCAKDGRREWPND